MLNGRRFALRALMGGVAVLAVRAPARAQSVQYTYDALGRLASVTYPGGIVTTYTYDAAGNRTQVSTGSAPPPPPPVPLAASVSATSWSGSNSEEDSPVAVSVTGGTPPYAYAWQRVTGDLETACFPPNSSAVTWYYWGESPFPVLKTSTWRCQVTDAASGSTFTPNVSVAINVS